LALSEELERERRKLQEDEQTLMEQMREMEVGMAKERAELARQRNDLQRLQGEIRHELERLEKSGAIQSKIEGLKNKLQDATTRRGAAHGAAVHPSAQPVAQPATPAAEAQQAPAKKDSLMGRLFGSKK
jgi:chromosome segregation ATPase